MFSKYFIFLMLIVFNINYSICWKAILDRYEITYINTRYSNVTIKLGKYNRTAVAVSVYIDTFIDVPAMETIELKLYGKMSNAYRQLPLTIRRRICDIVNYEYKWIKDDLQGHIPEKCPIKKDFYYVENYVPNVSRFPKNRAWKINEYMISIRVFAEDILHGTGKLYVKTSDDDEYYKKSK